MRRRLAVVGILWVFCVGVLAAPAYAHTGVEKQCLIGSGTAASRCVRDYTAAVGACRNAADAACESALRAPGGAMEALLADTEAPTRRTCRAGSADLLTFSLGIDDLAFRTAQACEKWSEDFLQLAYADDLTALSPAALVCQRRVAANLRRLRGAVLHSVGRVCQVHEFAGLGCDRQLRESRVAIARATARAEILRRCGTTFDDLGLSQLGPSATLEARVDDVVDRVVSRARHLALRIYPPLNLGPTELFGPYPIGVRTLDLVDPSRSNVTGTGPRPVKTEVYYPSTATAIAGVPKDILQLLGIDLIASATYRDVARAPGAFPVVLYSTGSPGIRFDNLILCSHLASHGFVVISPDHHGDELLDPDSDTNTEVNRPLDLSFLIDRFLAFNGEAGNFFEGAIDGTRIGATGHSYGGYTVMALATGPFHLGALGDPRVKAILPLDGSAQVFSQEFPGIFSTITVPTLLLGGTQSPFLAALLPFVFDALVPGPSVMAYGNLIDAGHLTFDDVCEVPEALIGFVAECEPDHMPWRHGLHIVNYLALNLFDGVLNGNAEALARLAPANLTAIEELIYQSK